MSATIVWKVYKESQAKAIASSTPVRYADLDRFALQTFNRLVYKQEISKSLVILYLLNFLDYYSHDIKL